MKYRINPHNGEKLSLLGFGAMRLPAPENDPEGIDRDKSVEMIRYAIDHGVNYIDTAYTYYEGASEETLAEALSDGYGDRIYVATKLPTMRLASANEHDQYLETSLKRLKRDCVDYYLLHGLKEAYWPTVQKCKTTDFLFKKKEENMMRNVGFSYHGQTFELFKEILDSAPWDFVQIQFNYMDIEMQAGMRGLKYAASKGLPVFIMEPLKGGKLTNNIPPSVQTFFDSIGTKRSAADWGLRWLANFPEITTILSGMSTLGQLKENIQIMSDADAGCMSADEIDVIAKVAEEFDKLIAYPCTTCRYCVQGCPKQIDIAIAIGLRNEDAMYDCYERVKFEINHFMRKLPSTCIGCGKCEEVCPQHLPIIAILKEIAEMYEDESQQWWREYV